MHGGGGDFEACSEKDATKITGDLEGICVVSHNFQQVLAQVGGGHTPKHKSLCHVNALFLQQRRRHLARRAIVKRALQSQGHLIDKGSLSDCMVCLVAAPCHRTFA